jgi:hypothetical protein
LTDASPHDADDLDVLARALRSGSLPLTLDYDKPSLHQRARVGAAVVNAKADQHRMRPGQVSIMFFCPEETARAKKERGE